MEYLYKKSFNTRISEYELQVEKTPKGKKYITLCRYVADKDVKDPSEKIHIHPEALTNLIDSLLDCSEVLGFQLKIINERFPLEKKEKIKFRYLRGISVKDLSIQFDTVPEKIEKILFEANIPILDSKASKPPKSYRQHRKKN